MKKRVVIGIICLLGAVGIATGSLLYYFNGIEVNGEKVAFEQEEDIKARLEKLGITTLMINGTTIDVSEATWKKAEDFEKHFGDQQVKVETGYDRDKVKSIVEQAYELGKWEKFDWDNLLDRVKVEENTDVSDCVVLKYKQEDIDLYEKSKKWTAAYVSGDDHKAVEKKDVSKYVKITKKGVKFDDSWVDSLVRKLEKQWDTIGRKRKEYLYSKKDYKTIQGGNTTWGTLMDSAKEKEYIIKQFHKGKPIKERTPYLKMNHDGAIGKTRIEVSISNQRLWYYKNGKLKKTTSVVTGKTGHSTPRGVYFISERVPGKYLTGPGYKTWVNRWMRLTGQGVGLHDANWRSNFGGSIYVSSGSHGCVNLPSSFAYWLYPKTYVGMAVIVY